MMKLHFLLFFALLIPAKLAKTQPCSETAWGDSRQEVHVKEDSPLRAWNAISSWYQELDGENVTITRYHFGQAGMDACTVYTVDTSLDFEKMDADNAREAEIIRSMGQPDRKDQPRGIGYEYWGWDLGETFAIAEVDKNNQSGIIWYALGKLPREGHRDLYRSWTGADHFGGDLDVDLPGDLQENPHLKPAQRVQVIRDEFEGVTWYDDPMRNTSPGVTVARLRVRDDGEMCFVFGLQYSGSSRLGGTAWIFLDQANFLVDGQRFELTDLYDQTLRETTSDGVEETYGACLDDAHEEIVRAIATAQEVAVRLAGERGRQEYEISEREKRTLRLMLDIYDSMNN